MKYFSKIILSALFCLILSSCVSAQIKGINDLVKSLADTSKIGNSMCMPIMVDIKDSSYQVLYSIESYSCEDEHELIIAGNYSQGIRPGKDFMIWKNLHTDYRFVPVLSYEIKCKEKIRKVVEGLFVSTIDTFNINEFKSLEYTMTENRENYYIIGPHENDFQPVYLKPNEELLQLYDNFKKSRERY